LKLIYSKGRSAREKARRRKRRRKMRTNAANSLR
jgi:hypothetical protein